MAIVLSNKIDVIDTIRKKFNMDNKNMVIFTSDYYCGKEFIKKINPQTYVYYYFYDQHLYMMEVESDIRTLQDILIKDKNYSESKIYNEFLIFVTREKQLPKWMFYPMIIQLEHTNRCNARCIMCGHANIEKSKCFDMNLDVFKKIKKFLPFCRHVGLHGYGEPFLARNLIKFFDVYKMYGVRLYVNSNLSYLPDEYFSYIADMFDEINISMDGFTEETYEYIRSGLQYSVIIKNIEKIRKYCPSVRLNLHVTLMRQNILESVEAIKFAIKYRFKKVVFNEMIALDANNNEKDMLINYPAITSRQLKWARDKAISLGVDIFYPIELIVDYNEDNCKRQENEIIELNKMEFSKKREVEILEKGFLFNRQLLNVEDVNASGIFCKGICDVFQEQFYIDADGKMAVCCVDGYHFIGNVLDIENIEDYWNNDQIRLLTECFRRNELPAICKRCNYILLNNLKHLCIDDRQEYAENLMKRR